MEFFSHGKTRKHSAFQAHAVPAASAKVLEADAVPAASAKLLEADAFPAASAKLLEADAVPACNPLSNTFKTTGAFL